MWIQFAIFHCPVLPYSYMWRHSPGTGWSGFTNIAWWWFVDSQHTEDLIPGVGSVTGLAAQAKPARFVTSRGSAPFLFGFNPGDLTGLQGVRIWSAGVCILHHYLLDHFLGLYALNLLPSPAIPTLWCPFVSCNQDVTDNLWPNLLKTCTFISGCSSVWINKPQGDWNGFPW